MEYSQVEQKVKLQVMKFYDALEKRIKRHPPQKYISYCAKRFTQCRNDIKKFVQSPPHNLLHSIEANCAYYKEGYTEPVSWNKFARIMNVYHDYGDNLFLNYTIEENSDRFFLMMAKQQFELQDTPSKGYMARVWSLFVDNLYTVKLAKEFQQKYKMSMEQWFHLMFLLWVAANQRADCIFKKDILLNCDFYMVSQDVIDSLYSYISYTIREIKENYLSIRKQENIVFHFLIRSVFLERPIIDFNDGNMIAPHPDLIFLHSGEGLLKLISSIDGYESCISKSFENYTKDLLNCLENKAQILSCNELEKIVKNTTGGKSCDYLIETDSEIVLVECKATSFTAKMFTDNAILNNNSTGQIAAALIQFYTTAYDLHNGVFDAFSIDKEKPVIGFVVTLGKLPLVNSNWYFDKFIIGRADKKLKPPIFPSNSMKFYPIVMSIETFEHLIVILNNVKTSVMELHNQKENEKYAIVGDWDAYLRSKLQPDYNTLSIVESNNNKFFESMGVGV
ncbi:MAG: hypothetical protein JW806_04140 [Sedimentisphaerales bacterium]|nr:hypothetical protein [Sedimentisphaerales bacterium]